MRILKVAAMAACVVMGGIVLGGCQAKGGSGVGGSSAAGVQATGTVSVQGTSSRSAATSDSGGESSSYGICQASGLKISLDGQNKLSSQIVEWVQLSNTTSTPCTMDGFAGVNLVGSAHGESNYAWPLTRDSESYSKIVLTPGESAYFGIKYLPWASGDGTEINVANIVLTPPNTTTSITLPWSASVELQDSATAPGTYLTPVALGGNG